MDKSLNSPKKLCIIINNQNNGGLCALLSCFFNWSMKVKLRRPENPRYRHSDEVLLDIGDAVHVDRTCEDHWCYGLFLAIRLPLFSPTATVFVQVRISGRVWLAYSLRRSFAKLTLSRKYAWAPCRPTQRVSFPKLAVQFWSLKASYNDVFKSQVMERGAYAVKN